MKNDQLIDTLNDLIQISKDGEQGFRTCAADAPEYQAHYKDQFLERAQACSQAVLELQNLVRTLGGKPATHSTISGALHRRWLNLKTAIMGRDDEVILNECERGEDVAVHAYRKALEQDLPSDVRQIVERQYQGVLANHDRVKELRDQARAKKAT